MTSVFAVVTGGTHMGFVVSSFVHIKQDSLLYAYPMIICFLEVDEGKSNNHSHSIISAFLFDSCDLSSTRCTVVTCDHSCA